MKINRILFIGITSVLCVLLAGMVHAEPGQPVDGQPYRSVTASDVVQMMEQQEVYLLDVREAQEVESGMLPNAVNYPLSDFSRQIEQADLPTDAYIVVYCSSGMRSTDFSRRTLSVLRRFSG